MSVSLFGSAEKHWDRYGPSWHRIRYPLRWHRHRHKWPVSPTGYRPLGLHFLSVPHSMILPTNRPNVPWSSPSPDVQSSSNFQTVSSPLVFLRHSHHREGIDAPLPHTGSVRPRGLCRRRRKLGRKEFWDGGSVAWMFLDVVVSSSGWALPCHRCTCYPSCLTRPCVLWNSTPFCLFGGYSEQRQSSVPATEGLLGWPSRSRQWSWIEFDIVVDRMRRMLWRLTFVFVVYLSRRWIVLHWDWTSVMVLVLEDPFPPACRQARCPWLLVAGILSSHVSFEPTWCRTIESSAWSVNAVPPPVQLVHQV